MKFSNKKLIIFDFDGTLIDSVPDLVDAVNYMLCKLSRETFSETVIRSWVGNGAQTLVKRALLGKVGIDEALEPELFEKALAIFLESYSNNLCKKTKLYDNVLSSLESLYQQGYQMAIVTNKPSAFIQPILEALAIKKYFKINLGSDSLSEKKPSPMPLIHVCQQLAIAPDKALMVGDSKNDILAAQSANIDSIGVSYGYNYGDSIEIYKPTVVIDDFSKILDLLKK